MADIQVIPVGMPSAEKLREHLAAKHAMLPERADADLGDLDQAQLFDLHLACHANAGTDVHNTPLAWGAMAR